MSDVRVERARTGWDVALGALLFVAGIVLLGHAVFATSVSIMFIGWLLVSVGVLGLAASVFSIGRDGFWSAALGGGLMAVLGLVVLRHPTATAATLTLVAGAMFLVSGVMRLVASVQDDENRFAMVFSGALSAVLGLIVLFNLFTASYVLLGVMLAVQVLSDGVAMMFIGRVHVVAHRPTGATPLPH